MPGKVKTIPILVRQSNEREPPRTTTVVDEEDSTEQVGSREFPVGEYNDRGPWQSLYGVAE